MYYSCLARTGHNRTTSAERDTGAVPVFVTVDRMHGFAAEGCLFKAYTEVESSNS